MNQKLIFTFHKDNGNLIYLNYDHIVRIERDKSDTSPGTAINLINGSTIYVIDSLEDVLTMIKSQVRVVE
jgi:uncharacterized protein YlzI (FlbEa/FlbD family)